MRWPILTIFAGSIPLAPAGKTEADAETDYKRNSEHGNHLLKANNPIATFFEAVLTLLQNGHASDDKSDADQQN